MERKKAIKKVAVLTLIPEHTAAYLDAECAKIAKRFSVRTGKAVVLRGLAEALEAVRFPVAEAGPGYYDIKKEITTALTAFNAEKEGK